MWTCYIWSPVRVMNRTVRRRQVAVPWSLFLRELSVGQVLFFSGEGMPAGHGMWFVFPVRRGKGLTCQSFPCGSAVCSGLFLAGILNIVYSCEFGFCYLNSQYPVSLIFDCVWLFATLYGVLMLSNVLGEYP